MYIYIHHIYLHKSHLQFWHTHCNTHKCNCLRYLYNLAHTVHFHIHQCLKVGACTCTCICEQGALTITHVPVSIFSELQPYGTFTTGCSTLWRWPILTLSSWIAFEVITTIDILFTELSCPNCE